MDAQNQPIQQPQQAASPPPGTVSDDSYQAVPQQQQQHQQPQQQQQQYQQQYPQQQQQQYPQQQQYTQQPMYFDPRQQPMMPAGSRRLVLYSKKIMTTQIVLRSLDIVFAIVLIALSVYSLFDFTQGIWFFCFCIPAAGIALLWEMAELITICARRGKLGIHPGAHVGVHLLIWLILCVGIGFSAAVTAYSYEYTYDRYYGSRYYYPDRTSAYATIAFMALMLVLHFVLFIMACVETGKVNRQHLAPMFLVQQPNGQLVAMDGTMLQQPMPVHFQGMHQQQQPMMMQQQPPQQPPMSQRQSRFSMAGSQVQGAEPKQASYSGGVTPQNEAATAQDGTYYGQGNEYGRQ